MDAKSIARSFFLVSVGFLGIFPSILLLLQIRNLPDPGLLITELARTTVLTASVFYLAVADRKRFVSSSKSPRAWYPTIAIFGLAGTNLFASTSVRILLVLIHAKLKF